MSPWTDQEYNEIICVIFDDNVARFGITAVDAAKEGKTPALWLSRAEFRLMTWMDLGDKWDKYADEAPTLFLREELKND